MTDTRFSTVANDLDDLLSVVDVDDLADIETLLMVLFDQPIGVEAVAGDGGDEEPLEVTVWADGVGIGSMHSFPMSMLGLVVACAATVAELEPDGGDGADASPDSLGLLAMDEAELITALQRALGEVRLYNMLAADG